MGKKCKCIFWVVKIALIGDQPLAGKCAAFFPGKAFPNFKRKIRAGPCEASPSGYTGK